MKGRFKQVLIREGDAETREGQSRNNSIALGQGPGSTSRDSHNNIFEFFCRTKEGESEVAQSCLTLCDPLGCSLPGSSVHGIF